MLPWSEMEGFHRETGSIQQQLQQLNLQGYFTINSQPQVNGAPSSDAKVGWGGTDGYASPRACAGSLLHLQNETSDKCCALQAYSVW